MRRKLFCTMCQLDFFSRTGAKTCSPRCRKRRERIIKGKALGAWKMGQGPSPTASKMWR